MALIFRFQGSALLFPLLQSPVLAPLSCAAEMRGGRKEGRVEVHNLRLLVCVCMFVLDNKIPTSLLNEDLGECERGRGVKGRKGCFLNQLVARPRTGDWLQLPA